MTKRDDKTRAKILADRPEPTEKQAAHIAEASARVALKRHDPGRPKAPRTKVAYFGENKVLVASPHTDDTGWAAEMADALGTGDGRVADMLQSAVSRVSTVQALDSQADADRFGQETEQVLAFIAENAPANPVEASLLMQMAAVQQVSMSMVAGALQSERRDAKADYVRLMNQTMRTFSAQAETLHKLRTGGKQQVEVRYVYVDARTQTVVNTGGERGGLDEIGRQPHAPGGLLGHAVAAGLPMRCADTSGDGLPIAGGEGASAMPDARRQKSGRTPRRGQRELRGRTVDGGDDSDPGGRSGAPAAVS